MDELITKLKASFPKLKFTPGEQFFWAPETGEIFYKAEVRAETAIWSLLHETGHALLGHTHYRADVELVKLEVAAWQKAQELAAKLGLNINEDHIQDCLDTYRDWLHKRSLCPDCSTSGLQQNDYVHYRCFNCHKTWRVSTSRFARAYRRHKNVPQPAGLHLQTEL